MGCKRATVIISVAFLIFASACNLPGAAAVSGANPSATLSLQTLPTQIAQDIASTAAAQTALAKGVDSTLAAMITDTPEFTLTPSSTPTPTFTLTPETPKVGVTVETNCRSGPGSAYDILGVLSVGQSAEVVGRSAAGDNWIIKLPSNPAVTCWVWGQYATVTGNTSGLPVISPPPTPTPAPSFTFSYKGFGVGPGYQCFMFDVTNTGGLTWESYSLTVHDITQDITGTDSDNAFVTYDQWCGATDTHLDLVNGEMGTTSAEMTIVNSPAGDQFEATLTLCSGNDQTGYCTNKTITFTF